LLKAKKRASNTVFAEGEQSLDNTGEQSEADFPLYVQLFEDFFTWKANALPDHARERDTQLRDQRRHHSHLFVRAQVSILHFICKFFKSNIIL
jgi:hypothetical protein